MLDSKERRLKEQEVAKTTCELRVAYLENRASMLEGYGKVEWRFAQGSHRLHHLEEQLDYVLEKQKNWGPEGQ